MKVGLDKEVDYKRQQSILSAIFLSNDNNSMCSDKTSGQGESLGEGKRIDGSHPLTSDQMLAQLEAAGVSHHTVEHPPMRTVEDAKALRAPSEYGHTKNLFVRNKKGSMWLLTLHEDRLVDLKATAAMVGTNRFSFASEQRLMQYLGVFPGAVSPFSILNDITGQVAFYIDEKLMAAPALHVHPLINTRTTTVERESLLDFIRDQGHQVHVLCFGE